MTIGGKDRRGLGEIVAFTGTMLAVAGIIVAEIVTHNEVPRELMGAFVALVLVVCSRGTQSAMERGASSEQFNRESTEIRQVAAELRREADELRRANDVNRVLALQAQAQRDKG
jgi:hypothetical protein